MESIINRTVAEIVADDYKTADVFKKYGIDEEFAAKLIMKAREPWFAEAE